MDLTETEQQLIKAIRELRPFQELVISKDKNGKSDSYFINERRAYAIGIGYMKIFKDIS